MHSTLRYLKLIKEDKIYIAAKPTRFMKGLEYIRELYGNYISKRTNEVQREVETSYASPRYNSSKRGKYAIPVIAATLCLGTILSAGDGSDEPGFVAPPQNRSAPPAPPRTISSGENTDPCCCCPVTPVARTEAKKPPQPPVLITKMKDK